MKVFQGECEYQSLMYVCRFAVVVVAIATTIGIQKSRRNHKTFATELQIGNEFILFECISVTTIPSAKTARASYSSIFLNLTSTLLNL